MCVTARQEMKQSSLPLMAEKSCFMLQPSCLTQRLTLSRSYLTSFWSKLSPDNLTLRRKVSRAETEDISSFSLFLSYREKDTLVMTL